MKSSFLINCSSLVSLLIVINVKFNEVSSQSLNCMICDSEIINNITGSLIDSNIDPCYDFYEYSCGNWLSMSKVYHLEGNIRDVLEILLEKVLWKYKNVIESQQKNLWNLNNSERKVIKFYQSCLNHAATQSKIERLQPFLHELHSIGRWPILDNTFGTSSSSFNWIRMAAILRRYGVQTIFRELVKSNWRNSSEQVIYFVQPKLSFVRQNGNFNTIDDDDEFLYKTDIKHILLDLGLKVRQAKSTANQIFSIEANLMNLMRPESLIDVPEPQKFENLIKTIPGIDWKLYLDTLIGTSFDLSHLTVIVQDDYFRKLNNLMERINPEILAKYFLVKFLLHFKDIFEDRTANWKTCLNDVGKKMGSALHYMAKRQEDSQFHSYESVNSIFSKIKNVFKSSILNSDWLDSITKSKAVQKLNALAIEIGGPIQDIQEIDEYFKDFSGNEVNYFKNIINYAQFETQKEHLKLFGKNSNFDNSNPIRANAYYQLSKNKITIPSSVLEPPLYHESYPIAAKFGGLGSILGHELVHGFDLDGRNYDENGNAVDWWTVRSFLKYWEKAECIMNQNGRQRSRVLNTLNEDIADNAGLKLSFQAYKNIETQTTNRNEQLFFLSFAQVFCGSTRSPRQEVSSNSKHVEHRSRVNNVLSNFASFSMAYHCRLGSNMNERIKCELW